MKTSLPLTAVWLPDIRSGWNVGAFFRTADSLGVEKIFLSGVTPYPPHKEIYKTALDAENFVDWSYFADTQQCLEYLQAKKIILIAMELTTDAEKISAKIFPNTPCCLIMGNEITGVDKKILSAVEKTIYIPMKGKKQSMNVSIAGAIGMYEMTRYTKSV